LRESVRQGLKRADAVIVMGHGNPIFEAIVAGVAGAIVPQDDSLKGKRAFAFAGIGSRRNSWPRSRPPARP